MLRIAAKFIHSIWAGRSTTFAVSPGIVPNDLVICERWELIVKKMPVRRKTMPE